MSDKEYKPYNDSVNYFLISMSLLPWLVMARTVFINFHGDAGKVLNCQTFGIFVFYLIYTTAVIATGNYRSKRWTCSLHRLIHSTPNAISLVAILSLYFPGPVAGVKSPTNPITIVPDQRPKVVDPVVVEEIVRQLTDSTLPALASLRIDWRNSRLQQVKGALSTYRLSLLDRLIRRDQRTEGMGMAYRTAVNVMGTDPLAVADRLLQQVCALDADIRRIINSHDLNEVKKLFVNYHLSDDLPTLTYAGDLPVSFQSLKGFLMDKIQDLEKGHIEVVPPDDYPRHSCTLNEFRFIVVEPT